MVRLGLAFENIERYDLACECYEQSVTTADAIT
jgi:hypothetical protein